MSSIFLGKTFSRKNVAEMRLAICAGNFGARAVDVDGFFYCARDFIIKTWSTTSGRKFIFGFVQPCPASTTRICPLHCKLVILAGKWRFRSLVHNNPLFL